MRGRTVSMVLRLLGLGLVAALPLVAACSSSSTSNSTTNAVAGGTMNVRIIATWPTLDPQVQGSKGGYEIDGAVYDWLVYYDGKKVIPFLATSWTETATSVKFTLRKDATCADGTPVTPSVVAGSFNRFLLSTDPRVLSVKRTWPAPYTVQPDDANSTITIGIGRPFSGLLLNFSQLTPAAAIVCPKGVASPASLATTPDGSGPYKLTNAVSGDSATVVARPEYHWGPDGLTTRSPGVPQTIVYKVVVNETTTANLLETGGLDIGTVGGPDVQRLTADKSLIHHSTHGFSSSLLSFNEGDGHITDDQAVRQALATSIDTKAYGTAAYQGSITPATSFLTNDANCYDPTTKSLVPTPSVDKAKQIMTSAGYTTGSDGKWQDKNHKPITIAVAGEEVQGEGPTYLAAQFQAAGFNVTVNQLPESSYAQVYFNGNWDVLVNLASSPTPDPNGGGSLALSTGATPPNGSNYLRKDYPDIDSEIAAANAAVGSESCKHWDKVQELLLSRYIVLPLGAPQYQWYSRNIQFTSFVDFQLNPLFLKRIK